MKALPTLRLAVTALVVLIAQSPAQIASPPSLIDYQGQLLNSIGGPLTGPGGPGTTGTAANFEIRFRLWDAQTGGNLIWAEKQIATVDENGFFSVRLGEGEAITVANGDPNPLVGSIPHSGTALLTAFDQNERFLGVTVMNPPDTPGEIQPRLRFLTSPFAIAAEKARYAEFGPVGGVFAADQIGIGTTTPNTALHLKNTGSLELRLEADSDDSGEGDQPSLTFSQDGGNQTTSLGYFNNTDDFGIRTNGTQRLTVQSGGNVGIGTASPAEDLHVQRGDSDLARIYATGSNSGGGLFFAGQSPTYGGGFFYEGDATPDMVGNSDRTVFFRRNNGNEAEVFSYAYNSNNVNFTGRIGVGTENPSEAITIANGNIALNYGNVTFAAGVTRGPNWWYAGALLPYAWITHDSSNRIVVSNGFGAIYMNSGATSWTSNSDERLKSDIEPLTGILDKIEDIRVVGYNMAGLKPDPATGQMTYDHDRPPRRMKNGRVIKHEIGTIAQDWLKDFPELVSEPAGEGDYYGLAYDRIGVVAIGAVQELNHKLKECEAKIEERDAKIADLETRLAKLEALLSRSSARPRASKK